MNRIVLPAPIETPWEQNNQIPALLEYPADTPKAGIIVLHGYTGRKETMEYITQGLAASGYLVLAPDLPLHGERALGQEGDFEYPFYGDPSGVVKAFQNALADVQACAVHLRDRLDNDTPLGLVGFSLGGCLTILAKAQMPETFQAGVSIVGAARLARLLLVSTICTDISHDLQAMGYDESSLEPILQAVEATDRGQYVENLMMFGADDDVIVPGALVRETFEAFPSESNELVMVNGTGHFPPLELVGQYALPFLARHLGGSPLL